ncbi:NAD(P)-dependent alcohol dehydrogenase [bacterium]|nr:MAG: NAD(P)-dependent alcohol dehydrogenase [bacterium]
MKAAYFSQYGSPDVISIKDIPAPTPLPNQILIKNKACTVNRTDSGFRSAEYFVSRFFSGLFKPKFHVLGTDFAGEVVGIGADVKRFKIGDSVFGFDDSLFGGHAEYLVIDENKVVTTFPDSIPYTIAACIFEGGHYALSNIKAANLHPGQTVLINGGTGSIGSAAIQICKHFGAHVTALCGGEHLDIVKDLGADEVYDYTKIKTLSELNKTFDFVFDAVGKRSFAEAKPILKENGIYISTELGKHLENPLLGILGNYKKRKRVLFPIPVSKAEDAEFLRDLVINGSYKPLIDPKKFEFEEIAEAYRYIETGQKIGNVVLSLE